MPENPTCKNQKANSREYRDNYDRIFGKTHFFMGAETVHYDDVYAPSGDFVVVLPEKHHDKEMRRLRWEVKNLREKEK